MARRWWSTVLRGLFGSACGVIGGILGAVGRIATGLAATHELSCGGAHENIFATIGFLLHGRLDRTIVWYPRRDPGGCPRELAGILDPRQNKAERQPRVEAESGIIGGRTS